MLVAYNLPAIFFDFVASAVLCVWHITSFPSIFKSHPESDSVFAWHINILFAFDTGIHTNWSYCSFTSYIPLLSVSAFQLPTVVSSGTKYITNPFEIVCSPSIPDIVNPFGIIAVSPLLSIYSVFSVTLFPAIFGNE